MSVWYAIPTKRARAQADAILKLWAERGYKIALWVDWDDRWQWEDHPYQLIVSKEEPYPGYATAVNHLVKQILALDPEAEWIVTGGDDVEPDLNHSAEVIARECLMHFEWGPQPARGVHDTFGVMQPTGDRWGDGQGAYIDRVCGSPWIGREFAGRMYGGTGPYFDGYTHMGVDEELQAVAQNLGVLWQRPDLIHFHRHWGRPARGRPMVSTESMPAFLRKANSPEEWQRYKKLFAQRMAEGFPGHEPI